MTDSQLAAFQIALLESLDRLDCADDILLELKNNPDLVAFQDYLNSFEPSLVEVAAELVKTWGQRHPD